ncbi:hypothetical protein [Bradyrhizobium embrapense]
MFIEEEEEAELKFDQIEGEWQELAPGVRRKAFEGSEPVRRILTGHRDREVGGFWSYKMNAHAAHESEGWERRGFALQECHTKVRAFYGQPEALEIRVDDEHVSPRGKKIVRYFLDDLSVIGGLEVRMEFKPLELLQPAKKLDPNNERSVHRHKKAGKLRRKLRLVRQAYRLSGLVWMLLTEREMDAMSHPDVIEDIISNGGREIDGEDLARVCAALVAAPDRQLPMHRCEELVHKSDFPRGALLARIPERVLCVDLREPIDEATMVRLEKL